MGTINGRRTEPSQREREEAELVEQMKEVFEANKGRYGSPRGDIVKSCVREGRRTLSSEQLGSLLF